MKGQAIGANDFVVATKIRGTGRDEDADTVVMVPDPAATFGRRMYDKKSGEEIPFGQYPNIDWS